MSRHGNRANLGRGGRGQTFGRGAQSQWSGGSQKYEQSDHRHNSVSSTASCNHYGSDNSGGYAYAQASDESMPWSDPSAFRNGYRDSSHDNSWNEQVQPPHNYAQMDCHSSRSCRNGSHPSASSQRSWRTTMVARCFSDHLCLANTDAVFNLPWSLLNLASAPDIRSSDAELRWRFHLVGARSQVGDFQAGPRNTWKFTSGNGHNSLPLRTGIADITYAIAREADVQVEVSWEDPAKPRILRLLFVSPLPISIEHRQPEQGLRCLCPEAVAATSAILARRGSPSTSTTSQAEVLQVDSVSGYQQLWRGLIELEAASAAVEEGAGRFLFDVWIQWSEKSLESSGEVALYGTFTIGVSLIRVHKVKFRSAIEQGEWGSSWLCIQRLAHGNRDTEWAGHGAVVRAAFLEDDQELEVNFGDDEDEIAVMPQQIKVTFRLVVHSSDPAPHTGMHVLETVPKALASSCQASSLALLQNSPLTQSLVLIGHPCCCESKYEVDAGLESWSLNPSQAHAIRHALSEPLTLVQGPPGTGKTRTTAVLASLLAKRNIGAGENRAVLFCAPTNRAVDCAVLFVAQICSEYAANLLQEHRTDDSNVCAICLQPKPDTITVCGHVFHTTCLRQVLQSSRLCPICRRHVKHPDSGLRILRIYGADAEQQEFPVPRRYDHPMVETRKPVPVPEEIRRFSLHWRCHAAVDGETPTSEAVAVRTAYRQMLEHGSKGPRADTLRDAYQKALAEARAAEIRDADIIFTTCVSCRRMAVAEALSRDDAPIFRQVIIDEAGQATEPEALCPLTFAHQAQQICLFGDHQQLRPILKSRQAEIAGLHISLFERIALAGSSGPAGEPCFLAWQYRMHAEISAFSSAQFYQSRLLDDASTLARPSGVMEFPAPAKKPAALLFWDFQSSEASSSSTSGEKILPVRTSESGACSRTHNIEAQCAADVAENLTMVVGPGRVGILAWYNAQVAAISALLTQPDIHVGSIATAQGSEWDYVILSTVRRGGAKTSLGIVSDPHMLNVALTRARLGLLVLGHSTTLSRDTNWNAFIGHCRSSKVIVQSAPAISENPELLTAAVRRILKPGTRVVLQGLQSSPELNGSEGEVLSQQESETGRWEVQLISGAETRRLSLKPANLSLAIAKPKQQGPRKAERFSGLSALVSADRRGGGVEFSKKLSLKPANLENLSNTNAPLKHGSKVRLHSLNLAACYNGMEGKIRSKQPAADGRWEVEISRVFDLQPAKVQAKPGKSGRIEVTSQGGEVDDTRFGFGVNVMLQGLQGDEAGNNGEWGVVVSTEQNPEGLWEVEIIRNGSKQRLMLKPLNMAPEALSY